MCVRATQVGYGADAVCPYLAYQALFALQHDKKLPASLSHADLVDRYIKSVDVGILKVMAKMGISTLASYKGAQIFEALGLDDVVVAACFKGTPSRVAGAGWEQLGRDALQLHALAYTSAVQAKDAADANAVPHPGARLLSAGGSPGLCCCSRTAALLARQRGGVLGASCSQVRVCCRWRPVHLGAGDYHWRAGPDAERHLNDPDAIAKLQAATQGNNRELYKQFSAINTSLSKAIHLRGLLRFKSTAQVRATTRCCCSPAAPHHRVRGLRCPSSLTCWLSRRRPRRRASRWRRWSRRPTLCAAL